MAEAGANCSAEPSVNIYYWYLACHAIQSYTQLCVSFPNTLFLGPGSFESGKLKLEEDKGAFICDSAYICLISRAEELLSFMYTIDPVDGRPPAFEEEVDANEAETLHIKAYYENNTHNHPRISLTIKQFSENSVPTTGRIIFTATTESELRICLDGILKASLHASMLLPAEEKTFFAMFVHFVKNNPEHKTALAAWTSTFDFEEPKKTLLQKFSKGFRTVAQHIDYIIMRNPSFYLAYINLEIII